MPTALFGFQIILVGAVLQSGFALYLIARSLPKERLCAGYKVGVQARCNAIVVMLGAMLSFSERDPLDQKIRQLIVRSRLELFRALLPISLVLNTCLLVNYIVRNRLWAELVRSWYGTPPEVDMAQQRTPFLLVLVFRQFLSVLFLAYPRLVNPACIRSGIALVYVRLAFEAYIQNETDFPAWVASTAPLRLGASVMLGELLTATCLNVLLSAVVCCCYMAEWHVTFHLYLCGVLWGVMYGIDCVRYAQFRAVLEARTSQSVEVAADGLLSRLCDAVVHLGQDLRMTQPSPHLSALLLRSSASCGGMKGVPFLDLFKCSEESERIQGFLLRDTPGADTLHASMKDSTDVVVRVQLFHICGRDFDDRIFHVVGVREDAESFRMPPEAPPSYATPLVAPLAEHVPSDEESVRTLQLENDSGDLAVYFKLFGTGYPVEKCSAGFTVLSGPSAPGTRLLEWIVSADSFVECVQELRDSALREGQDLLLRRSVQVLLRPPHLHSLGMELAAEAGLSLLHNDADSEVQLWTAKVELHDAKVVGKRGKAEKAALLLRAAAAPAPCEPDPRGNPCEHGAQATLGPPAGEPSATPETALEQPPPQPVRPLGALSQPPVHHVGRRSRSSLSVSSRTSSSSSGNSAPDAGRISSVHLRLDSTSPSLRVCDMVLCFGDGRRAPCLKDWLPRESLAGIHKRCEALVHESVYGGAEEGGANGALGALQFSRHGAVFLRAESAELTAAGSMADPSGSDQRSDDLDLTVIMELRGVSKLRMPWQSGRPGVSRSLHPIDESPLDAADDGDVTG